MDGYSPNLIDLADSSQKNVNIPDVVTGMQMLTVNRQEDNDPNFIIKRTLRRRTIQTSYDDTGLDRLNRRCTLKPKKRLQYPETEKQIKRLYLKKTDTFKRKASNLETIFEEQDDSIENDACMSIKRFKRTLQFDTEPTDSKIKKRRQRIKKVWGSKLKFKNRKGKMSMQAVIDKLKGIQNKYNLDQNSKESF